MPITTALTTSIRQIAAEAMGPSGSTLKIALLRVGETGTYDASYASAYTTGMGGDECSTANGYTQGGINLTSRTAGVSGGYGYVDYADAVWTATGALSAVGAVIYDSSQANRIVGFIDFGGTKTATDDLFTVQIPGSGVGFLRV